MTLSRLTTLTGAIWGLLLGGLAATQAMAVAAGVSWLYLFGDSPWPSAAGPAILAIGGAAFLLVFGGSVWAGLHLGRRALVAGPTQAQALRRKAARLLVLGPALLLGLLALIGWRAGEGERARRELDEQRAGFAELVAARQQLGAVQISARPAEMAFEITIRLEGSGGGLHRLSWRLRASAYNATLAEGQREVALDPGGNEARIRVDAYDLIGKYQDVVLDGRDADVEVAEIFDLEISLTPLLDEALRARLPPNEAHNLSLGESRLIERRRVPFPAHFRIAGPEYGLLE